MRTLSDKEILIKVKNGQLDYFTFLVKQYTKQIYNYIFRKLPQRDDVEDIVQNTFLKFYRAIQKFDVERPVLPYLFQIAKNELKMHWRAKKNTLKLDEAIATEDEVDYFEKGEIEKILSKLPFEQKKALELVGDGYSYKEIAKQLERPLNTVRTIIRRARLQLLKYKEDENS
ncbi:RNA polymerase sigma factor [Candidatus Roizmanbacteria bacterium]|nr:RNA polymerase sigma factor [Candidatus Roizmanbacteria bacterium]